MTKELLLIWDFDDTLVQTCVEYIKTNNELAELVSKTIYNNLNTLDEILKMQEVKDLKAIKELGYSPHRYLMSWLSTYSHFCKKEKIQEETSVMTEIIKMVTDLFDRPYELIPSAKEVLQKLKRKGYPMIILTAGAESVQKRKIKDSGLLSNFNDVYVCLNKTPKTLNEILDLYPNKKKVMIGNSLKSDIYPALENFIWGVHVERETWKADNYNVNKKHPKYMHASSIDQVPYVIKQIEILINSNKKAG